MRWGVKVHPFTPFVLLSFDRQRESGVQMLKQIIAIFIFAILAQSGFAIQSNAVAADKVVAKVNEAEITEDLLLAEVNKKIPMASFHSKVSEEKLKKIRGEALELLINEELLYQEAKRRKLQIDKQEVQQQLDAMKKRFASNDDFEKALARSGVTEADVRRRIERNQVSRELLKLEVYDKVSINASAMKQYYEANRQKFVLPPRFRVRHILISVYPGAMQAGWQAGMDKADSVYKRIMAGEDFALMAGRVSDDTTSNRDGGDIGWFHQGQLLPELENALEAMEIGEVSKPIQTIYGFHIIKLEAKKAKKQLSFDEIDKQSLEKRLLKKRIDERQKTFFKELRARANIQIMDM